MNLLPQTPLPWIGVNPDGSGFIQIPSGEAFIPWGFNYDRDFRFRLIEDYWDTEWPLLESHFRKMQDLGANIARVHLQFGRIMDGPEMPNAGNLERLRKLLHLAENHGIYVDLTGLGSYRKADDPSWYIALSERERWDAQAYFWSAVSQACADSPALFAYNLMNEPIVPGETRAEGEWVAAFELAGLRYLEFVCLDKGERERPQVARQWIRHLTDAIRAYDPRHMITVGIALGDTDKPEEEMGFTPLEIVGEVDYISVHLYPEAGKIDKAIETLRRCKVGKPLIVEEMFPMRCGLDEFRDFIERSRGIANGWIGFFWGQTPEDLRGMGPGACPSTVAWLEMFREIHPSL